MMMGLEIVQVKKICVVKKQHFWLYTLFRIYDCFCVIKWNVILPFGDRQLAAFSWKYFLS